jgi:hypothetical protein
VVGVGTGVSVGTGVFVTPGSGVFVGKLGSIVGVNNDAGSKVGVAGKQVINAWS